MANFKYTQLYQHLKEKILDGTFTDGDKLPTEAQLAKDFSYSRDTVRSAIEILEQEGLLIRTRGRGTFVCSPAPSILKRTNTSNHICLVMNDISNYIYPEIINGITATLVKNGYFVDTYFTSNQVSIERSILSRLIKEDIAGLIIEPTMSAIKNINADLYQHISQNIPAVLLHAKYPDLGFSSITTSDEDGSYQLTEYLLRNGHRDIALICKFDEQTGHNRYLGYTKALLEYEVPNVNQHVHWFQSCNTQELFSNQTDTALLQKLKECTAVICQEDRIAMQLIMFLQNHGIRVPEDISVAGFDNAAFAASFGLTSVSHPKEDLGVMAARQIITKIQEPGKDVSYHFSPRLLVRSSVMSR